MQGIRKFIMLRYLPLARILGTMNVLRTGPVTFEVRATILSALKGSLYSTSSSHAMKEQETAVDEDMPDFNMENPFKREPRQCILCKHNVEVDYKNVKLLSQFVSPYTGKLYEKHITGLCEGQQVKVKREIMKAKKCGMMPHYLKMSKFFKDPKLFNAFKPTRPNPH
ncbi:small ribosomal subunit protein bS18m [Dermacentor albipictus]|uniref:small ribosomal subunit protein bS18m n=1 Tax=Dermacentor albipictus TaxID=60249 RepID=UPI0031FCF791